MYEPKNARTVQLAIAQPETNGIKENLIDLFYSLARRFQLLETNNDHTPIADP